MDNNKKSEFLLNDGVNFYSILTVIFLTIAIIKGSLTLLNVSVFFFGLMVSTIFLGSLFSNEEEQVSRVITVISFILLIPLWAIVFVVILSVEIFKIITRDEKYKNGGEEYYDD